MPGLLDFTRIKYAPNSIYTVGSSTYTATLDVDEVDANCASGAVTVTLPAISSLLGTTHNEKTYCLKNLSISYNLTVQPGTSTITNVADAIGSKAVWTVMPNEYIVIAAQNGDTSWTITDPFSTPALERVPFAVCVATNSTGVVNVFDANGAPVNLDVTEILVNALDATAASITVTNGASTMVTINKGTMANAITGAGTISYAAVAAGSTFTIASSATNSSSRVTIIGTMQTLEVAG